MLIIAVWTLLVTAATWLGGWWGVVVVALVAGVCHRADGGRPWRVALATVLAWAGLLAFDAMSGSLPHVARTVGGATRAPAFALLVVTLLLAALLAWSAAIVTAELARLTSR